MPPDPTRPQVWLLGMPVKHSLSPSFQNVGFRHHELPWEYTLRPVTAEALPEVLDLLREGRAVRGANVTVPHKEAVAGLVDELGPDARLVGAVNTVVPRDGRLVGYNTDVFGFLRLMEGLDSSRQWGRALILGAGGASRAVVAALARSGVTSIVVANRSPQRAEALLASLAEGLREVTCEAIALDALSPSVAPELIVHTTSLGVGAEPGSEAFEQARRVWERLPWAQWPSALDVVDICYSATQTPMVAVARRLGLSAVDGLDMLLYQGTRAFELWTQRPAPVEPMRDALYQAVGRR
ncbi:MAG: shikimate dehydrogenase [Myxococcales bacterium]|nr:shikimate dehydrogenase [Myxococcales bacterium]